MKYDLLILRICLAALWTINVNPTNSNSYSTTLMTILNSCKKRKKVSEFDEDEWTVADDL